MKNKFFSLFIISLSTLIITGCSKDNPPSDVNNSSSEVTESVENQTEATTERVIEHNITPAENTYIYDEDKILSSKDFSECNDYAEWINETFMLNTAVVITSSLNEMTPEEYAKTCYNDIFEGKGSGILLLINNDTNTDYIYKQGTSSLYITETNENNAVFYASQDIVKGDFKSAILNLLALAETSPIYVFDNASCFNSEEITALENAFALKSNACVITTNNITDVTDEELAIEFFNRHFQDNVGNMLFIDKQTNNAVIISDGKTVNTDILTSVNSQLSLKDYNRAVELYLNSIS